MPQNIRIKAPMLQRLLMRLEAFLWVYRVSGHLWAYRLTLPQRLFGLGLFETAL